MTYNEWRDELNNNLLNVSEAERRRVLDYYAEAYADRRAAGFSEREIIAGFGAPYDAAQAVLSEDNYTPTPAPQNKNGTYARNTAYSAPSANNQPVRKKRSHGLLKALAIIAAVGLLIWFICWMITWFACRVEYQMRTDIIEGNFSAMEINVGVGDVTVEYGDVSEITVEYPTANVLKTGLISRGATAVFSSRVQNGFWGWNFSHIPPTVITLPQDGKYDLKIDIDAGKITTVGEFGNVEIDISAGLFSASDIVCTSFKLDISAGSAEVSRITCNTLNIDLSAGSANISHIICDVIDIDLSAGSANLYVVGTKSEYNISVKKSAGSCNVSTQTGTTSKRINIDLSAGSVNVNFKN